jgi:hypothetical protein
VRRRRACEGIDQFLTAAITKPRAPTNARTEKTMQRKPHSHCGVGRHVAAACGRVRQQRLSRKLRGRGLDRQDRVPSACIEDRTVRDAGSTVVSSMWRSRARSVRSSTARMSRTHRSKTGRRGCARDRREGPGSRPGRLSLGSGDAAEAKSRTSRSLPATGWSLTPRLPLRVRQRGDRRAPGQVAGRENRARKLQSS